MQSGIISYDEYQIRTHDKDINTVAKKEPGGIKQPT